jgi:hypothetical protein
VSIILTNSVGFVCVYFKATGRYHEDIFGVTLRTDDVTEKLRKLETRSEDNKSVADEIANLRSVWNYYRHFKTQF